MFQFDYYNPTRVVFGQDMFSQSGQAAAGLGKQTVVITGREHARRSGVARSLARSLEDAGVRCRVLGGIEANPTLETIITLTETIREDLPDFLIGLGGGSAMDAAKLISLALTHDGDLWEYRVTGARSVAGIRDSLLPVMTIATTAGTGSEISPAALATHQSRKEVFFSPHLYPKVAIIDPSLSATLPADLTAQIGIDAFVQSLEAYLSSQSQPFSDTFAIRGIQVSYEALPKLVVNPSDLDLRAEMSLASMLSLYAIGQAGVGAVHALSDPLSARHNIGHGLALSILLPHVLRANLDACRDKLAALPSLLGHDTAGRSSDALAEMGIALVGAFIQDLGLSDRKLSDFDIVLDEFPIFAAEAENPDMSNNPKKLTMDEKLSIYRSAY